jgi:hypothetical protein
MANVIYNSFKADLLDGTIDLDTDTIKVLLVTSSYTPNQDTHTQYSDITNEVVGTGYIEDGQTLTVTVSVDNTGNAGVFDAADVTWTDSTITARGAVIYKYVDNAGSPAATSPLICYVDFGENKSSVVGNFVITWDSTGIITLG